MRIGIDIDGVLTDIEKWQYDYGCLYFNKQIVNYNMYETSDIFDVTTDEDDQFWKEYLITYAKEEPARKFASNIINKLKQDGYEIYIITARSLTNKNDEQGIEMKNIVTNWLKEQNILYDKLIFSPEDKLNICIDLKIDIMIEDKPKNINDISTVIPVICFNASYNKVCNNENIYRVYSWAEIPFIINKLKN